MCEMILPERCPRDRRRLRLDHDAPRNGPEARGRCPQCHRSYRVNLATGEVRPPGSVAA